MKFSKIDCLFLFLTAILLGLVSWYGAFGDEQENITAGWLIVQGLVPYRDFFFHHAPLPFFLAGLAESLSAGNGLAVSRGLVVFMHLFVWGFVLRFSDNKIRKSVYISMILISGFLVPLFHLQMLLADTLVVLSLVMILFVSASWWRYNFPNPEKVVAVYVASTFIAVTSSVAASIAFAIIGLILVYKLISEFGLKFLLHKITRQIYWGFFLFAIFPVYFSLNKALESLWWSVFVYNQKYYLPFRLAENEFERKFGMIGRIIQQFYFFIARSSQELFSALRAFISTFIHIPMAISNNSFSELPSYLQIMFSEFFLHLANIEVAMLLLLLTTIMLLLWKKPVFTLPAILLLIFLRFRSNELFHIGPFVAGMVIFASVLFFQLKERKVKIALIFLCIPFLIITSSSYVSHFQQKNPVVSQVQVNNAKNIAENSQKDDSLLVIDGDTYLYYLSDRLPATRYFYYLPWFVPSERITSEVARTVSFRTADTIFMENVGENDYRYQLVSSLESNYSGVAPNVWKVK